MVFSILKHHMGTVLRGRCNRSSRTLGHLKHEFEQGFPNEGSTWDSKDTQLIHKIIQHSKKWKQKLETRLRRNELNIIGSPSLYSCILENSLSFFRALLPTFNYLGQNTKPHFSFQHHTGMDPRGRCGSWNMISSRYSKQKWQRLFGRSRINAQSNSTHLKPWKRKLERS